MAKNGLSRVVESGNFVWPWTHPSGLLVICGAAGGGGGGGGAFCLEDLNLYGARGGVGGAGGHATSVKRGKTLFRAAGGDGGGGDGGGLREGKPVEGNRGKGCHYGDGGDGGRGAVVAPADGRLTSDGGDGGKGFPGETRIVELGDLSAGDRFEITIGKGGGGGVGGKGFETGDAGVAGADGFVLFVPLFTGKGNK